jgi:hypothetical protein
MLKGQAETEVRKVLSATLRTLSVFCRYWWGGVQGTREGGLGLERLCAKPDTTLLFLVLFSFHLVPPCLTWLAPLLGWSLVTNPLSCYISLRTSTSSCEQKLSSLGTVKMVVFECSVGMAQKWMGGWTTMAVNLGLIGLGTGIRSRTSDGLEVQ